jgi:beta-lactamase regulating signal transducer with metallopeptidase domain
MTATQWLEVFLSFSLQVLIVVGATSLLERALGRSADQCSIWNTCFLSVLFLAGAAILLPRLHLASPWDLAEPKTLLSVAAHEAFIAKILLTVWALGAFASLFKWGIRELLLRRALRRCKTVAADEVLKLLQDLSYSEAKLPRVLVSDEVDGPFCLQLHQPVIVLPSILLEGSREDIQTVIVHELAHLKHNHPMQLFFQHLVQTIGWFHPIVWRASERASLTREYMCDDAVLASGVKCTAYLHTLLHIAERAEKNRQSPTIGFGKSPAELVVRAKRLVELAKGRLPDVTRKWHLGERTAIVLLAVIALCTTFVSVPTDPLSSSRTRWSTWPRWTARCLHCVGVNVRDYELFDRRVRSYEQLYDHGDNDTFRYELKSPSA